MSENRSSYICSSDFSERLTHLCYGIKCLAIHGPADPHGLRQKTILWGKDNSLALGYLSGLSLTLIIINRSPKWPINTNYYQQVT